MKKLLRRSSLLLTLTLLASLPGCAAKRAVMVHNGDVIRIGPDVTGHAYIWNAQTKQFELSANKVAYPEGWYCTDFNGGK